MDLFASSVVQGIVQGSLYALIALGPSLTYGLLRILDVANAAGLALGAYVGLEAFTLTGQWWLALVAGALAGAALGWLLQRLLYRPILGRGPIVPLVAGIGVFIAAEEAFRLVFGPYNQAFPAVIPLPTLELAGTRISGVETLSVLIGVTVFPATWLLLRRTRLGLVWRATSQDREIAQAVGINSGRVIASIFLLGYALAAIGGVLLGVTYNAVYPTMGDIPAYKMLAIIVLGGLGNPLGTVLAAMLLGLLETFVVAYFGFVLPRDAIAFIALILILLVRPQGLLPGDVVIQ
ncbi:MAG: branched-chain amino acid ABC transporter permease [Candidatus Limnocylindrales bacterium]